MNNRLEVSHNYDNQPNEEQYKVPIGSKSINVALWPFPDAGLLPE